MPFGGDMQRVEDDYDESVWDILRVEHGLNKIMISIHSRHLKVFFKRPNVMQKYVNDVISGSP